MYNLPFDKPGRFFRGNLHTHSTNSDGVLPPDVVCRRYAEAGYDFIALTDHMQDIFDYRISDTRAFRTSTFTTLIGAELHTGKTERGVLWDILAVGLPLDFAPYPPDETGPQVAARALAAGAFVAAAHPRLSRLTEHDIESLGDIHAIEVFNGTAHSTDRSDSWYWLDLMLSRGRHYTACANDDAHFKPENPDFMLGWVWVKSETNDPEALLDALKHGYYYASTGPQIFDVEVYPGEKVIIRCSPAERIYLLGKPGRARVFGSELTYAELPIENAKAPIWVTVADHYGRRAWTNPIWF